MIVRDRDVIVLVKGTTNPVLVDDTLAARGWPGGQGIQWADTSDDTFLVTFSDGMYGGFLLWGSNEQADQLTGMTGQQSLYKYATLCSGTWLISTSTFEKYTYQSRISGPLVENTFVVGGMLTFSLRGYFTPQDEWALSGDPRAPNTFFAGYIAQIPSPVTNGYLTVQTSI